MSYTEFKRLEQEAGNGPWSWRRSGCCGEPVFTVSPSYTNKGGMRYEDATFIAASRNIAPLLIAIIDALQSVICEESVRDELLCYVMGCRVLDLVKELEAADNRPRPDCYGRGHFSAYRNPALSRASKPCETCNGTGKEAADV